MKEPKDNEYASLLVGTKNDLVEKIKVKEDEAKGMVTVKTSKGEVSLSFLILLLFAVQEFVF